MAISCVYNKPVDLVANGEAVGCFDDSCVTALPADPSSAPISAEWDEGHDTITVMAGLERTLRADHQSADQGYDIFQRLLKGTPPRA